MSVHSRSTRYPDPEAIGLKDGIVPAQSRLTDKFHRLHISAGDLAECCHYLSEPSIKKFGVLQQALLTAAVIAYCRPFTHSDTGGRSTPMLPSAAVRHLDEAERKLHRRLLDMRHDAIAHSAFHRKPVGLKRVSSTGFMTMSRAFDVRSEITDIPAFRALATKQQSWCLNEQMRLNHEIRRAAG